jgi:hypothetical protein
MYNNHILTLLIYTQISSESGDVNGEAGADNIKP